jgi:hypothetical protein
MRAALLCAFILALGITGTPASEPEVDSVDYTTPEKYLDFPDSLGNKTVIKEQAEKLKGATDRDTICNVLDWMKQSLKYDGKMPYRWRNYDDMVREKIYGGCADEGIFCGVLLKGAGIPVVWVKTMDVSWIWDFKKGRPFQSWSGHVFLEVYVDHKWALLDPGGKTLYQDYLPKMRILPGRRFAYHKGNDPKAMIMSSQWEPWKQQTDKYFKELDETLLPVDEKGGAKLGKQAYIIGNSPFYQVMAQMAAESGLQVAMSFNCEYDKNLSQSRGHFLLIETHRGKPIVAASVLEKYFPNALKGITRPAKTIRINGTTIVFVEFSGQLDGLSK